MICNKPKIKKLSNLSKGKEKAPVHPLITQSKLLEKKNQQISAS